MMRSGWRVQPGGIRVLRGHSGLFPLGFDERQQLRSRIGADVLAVVPIELGAVEDSVGARDALESEERDQLRLREYLFPGGFALRSPAEQRKIIPERFRNDSLIAIGDDAGDAVALAEAGF